MLARLFTIVEQVGADLWYSELCGVEKGGASLVLAPSWCLMDTNGDGTNRDDTFWFWSDLAHTCFRKASLSEASKSNHRTKLPSPFVLFQWCRTAILPLVVLQTLPSPAGAAAVDGPGASGPHGGSGLCHGDGRVVVLLVLVPVLLVLLVLLLRLLVLLGLLLGLLGLQGLLVPLPLLPPSRLKQPSDLICNATRSDRHGDVCSARNRMHRVRTNCTTSAYAT